MGSYFGILGILTEARRAAKSRNEMHTNGPLRNLMDYAHTNGISWVHSRHPDSAFLDALSALRDVEIFVHRQRHPRAALAQADSRRRVREFSCGFAFGVPLYQRSLTCLLPSFGDLARPAEFSLYRRGRVLDCFGRHAPGWFSRQLSPDRRGAVRGRDAHRTLRSLQRQLDAHNADHGASRESARRLAGTQSCADQ